MASNNHSATSPRQLLFLRQTVQQTLVTLQAVTRGIHLMNTFMHIANPNILPTMEAIVVAVVA